MVRTRTVALTLLFAVLALAGCTTAEWRDPAPQPPQAGRAGGGPVESKQVEPAPDTASPAPAPATKEPQAVAQPPQQALPPKRPPATAAVPGQSPDRDDPDPSPSRLPVRKTTGSNSVALTFDDGPSPFTAQLLAVLRQQRVKATFCLVGSNVRARPDLVRRIVADGHTLCNHSWSHDLKLGTRPADEIRADLIRTNAEIRRAVPGVPIKYFRHPGGNFTSQAVSTAKDLGMTSIAWTVDPEDWDTKTHPAGEEMAEHVVEFVRANTAPGAIVLAHDGGGDRSGTVTACRILLPLLKAQYTLVALPR